MRALFEREAALAETSPIILVEEARAVGQGLFGLHVAILSDLLRGRPFSEAAAAMEGARAKPGRCAMLRHDGPLRSGRTLAFFKTLQTL
jgi:hypothetical protein